MLWQGLPLLIYNLKKIGTVVLLNKRMQGDKKWHLKNKKVVITGRAKGIAKEIVQEFKNKRNKDSGNR